MVVPEVGRDVLRGLGGRERDSIQTLVYFVSRALQGPELNYTPMEKLVIALVFAAKRLRSPEGAEFTYALRFQFTASNNEAEYEALLAELRIAAQIGVRNIRVSVDSKLVANQVLGTYIAKEENMIKYLEKVLIEVLQEKSIQEREVAAVVEEEGPTWITPITEYLKDGVLPDDKKEANKLRIKSRQYELMDRILYRRSFLRPWLRCVGPLQADYVIREIHEGSCNMHAGPRSVVAKAMRSGYYWPTMHRNAQYMIRKCKDCQMHRPVPRNPQQPLTPITSPWPFYKWGIDIAGPFPEGPGKRKSLCPLGSPYNDSSQAKGTLPTLDLQAMEGRHTREIGLSNISETAAVDIVRNDDEIRLNLDLVEERREQAAIRKALSEVQNG
ncbi:reverse transcriptase domain-containing protein [Tanacetum coccineum]